MIELLVTMAILSTLASLAIFTAGSVQEATENTKLRNDVGTLNAAVKTYLLSGGSIDGTVDGDGMITKLKCRASDAMAKRLPTLRGTMVDPRLKGVVVSTDGPERAVWDATSRRFELRNSGTGYESFTLHDTDADITPGEEDRKPAMLLAATDPWIWDHDHTPVGSAKAPVATNYGQETPTTTSDVAPNSLLAPEFSIPGGLIDYHDFAPALNVSLTDPNPTGTGRIYYSIANGPWIPYDGLPLSLPPALATQVVAYVQAADPDRWVDSAAADQTYETIYFTGVADGLFHSPSGDNRLVSNLAGVGARDRSFTWGSPATTRGITKPNELVFAGKSFTNIAPNEEFELGNLSYFNSTTWANTNAKEVKIAIDLLMTTPGVRETLNFTFKLLSTPNSGRSADEDADFVYIPDVSTTLRTTIKGRRYQLELRFGEHGINGFTTIDTFHAHENETLSGVIYGKFTLE